MAVVVTDKKITMDTAGDEVAMPVVVKTAEWIGGTAAGHVLILTQSSIGTITAELYRSVAAGPNFVDRSLKELHFPHGLRIDTIDSGQLDVYYR